MLHIYGIVQTHTEYVVAWYGTIVISINLLCLVFFFFFLPAHIIHFKKPLHQSTASSRSHSTIYNCQYEAESSQPYLFLTF